MSISKKISALILGIVLVSVGFMAIFSYEYNSKIIKNQINHEIMSIASSGIDKVNIMIDKEIEKLLSIADKDSVIKVVGNESKTMLPNDIEKINIKLESYVKRFGNAEHIFVVNKDGVIVSDSDRKLIGKNINDREYAKDTLSTGEEQISEVLVSKSTGQLIVVFTYPIKINGITYGFVGSAVYADSFSKYFKNVDIANTKSGYMYFVDNQGTMIYHPTKEKQGKKVENASINEVVTKIKNGEYVKGEIEEYDFKGKKKLSAYQIVPRTKWIAVAVADEAEILSPVKKMFIFLLIGAAILGSLVIFIGYIISRKMINPLKHVTKLVHETSKFNLAFDEQFVYLMNKKDEMGEIASAVAGMRQSLRDMVKNMDESSSKVESNASTMNEMVEILKGETDDTLATTEQLSAGMQETSAASEQVTSSINDISSAVNSIAERANDGTITAGEIKERADNIKIDAQSSNENAINLYNAVKVKMEDAIEESKSVEEINSLAQVILNITSQTNLLALNAAIEAARAGEVGKGFAVVADEIRKLAEESSQTASNIKDVVKKVNSSVYNLSENANNILQFIDTEVIKDYEKLIKTSEQYFKDAETVDALMSEFSATSQELTASINEIDDSMHDVAKTIEEGASGTQNIAAKTQSVVESIDKVKELSLGNIDSSNVLKDLISKFKL